MRLNRLARRAIGLGALAAALYLVPETAHATTGGGGFGWSNGLNQLSTSARGEIAAAFVILGCVGGGVEYLTQGQMGILLHYFGRACMVIGFLGGLVAIMSIFGMTGAVVP